MMPRYWRYRTVVYDRQAQNLAVAMTHSTTMAQMIIDALNKKK